MKASRSVKSATGGGGVAVILGAGASRSVSYAHTRDVPSPLNTDFFDLLQRLTVGDRDAVSKTEVLSWVSSLPHNHWRSMERAFYTLQQRAYLAQKFGAQTDASDVQVIGSFARCVQALLRTAHGLEACEHHQRLLNPLSLNDVVVTFNYDLVVERALRKGALMHGTTFGPWLYGLDKPTEDAPVPVVLKLHGSSNWRVANKTLTVRTKRWADFDKAPGYTAAHNGEGTAFPIFLPFWDKRVEEEPWVRLWKRAYNKLSTVSRVIVWGYSLPETDVKAQQLVTLGLTRAGLRLCVIDPAVRTRERWRELLPDAQYWEYDRVTDFFEHPPAWWNVSPE